MFDQTTPSATAVRQKQEEVSELAKMEQLVNSSQEVLYAARTVFPLDLFPDTVCVDRTKVTITHRSFLLVGGVITMRIEDILNVAAQVGPFFGSVQLTTRYFEPHKPYRVNWLWRNQALKLKTIIQGLVTANGQNINAAALERPVLVDELTKLGNGVDGAP